MIPVSYGKSHAKTHGQHNKQVLRNLWCLLCEDSGNVMFNASVMMEYVIIALILALAEVVGCVWGWKAWGWSGLFFGFFGGAFLGALVYGVGSAICAVIRRILACFSCRHETINGYKWSYSIIDGRVKMIAFSPHSGAISIPATLGHCPVTSIEQGVFTGCRDLTGVAIPSGVTSIGDRAFYGCSGLMSVTIPDSVTSIGREAFCGCNGLADAEGLVIVRNVLYSYHGAGGSVTIPDGVTSIGDSAFRGCCGLTSVTIPNSVTSIGDSAFRGCSGLADAQGFVILRNVLYSYHGEGGGVAIPDGVTRIGAYAFEDCDDLTGVTIPDSVTSIGKWAFSECFIESVTLPANLVGIEDDAYFWAGITNLKIPEVVAEFDLSLLEKWGVFLDCCTVHVGRETVIRNIACLDTWKGVKIQYYESENAVHSESDGMNAAGNGNMVTVQSNP